MSAPSSSSSAADSASRESAPRRRANYADPGMRVSDAERAEVADRLSQHYGDGRLNQEEFSRRLDQAMGATTQGDLSGLFNDLPEGDEPQAGAGGTGNAGNAGKRSRGSGDTGFPGTRDPAYPRRPQRGVRHLVGLVLIVIIAIAVGHAVAALTPWVLIAVIAFLLLRFGPWQRRRR
jgi:Domain of unknown function (DUF1707)